MTGLNHLLKELWDRHSGVKGEFYRRTEERRAFLYDLVRRSRDHYLGALLRRGIEDQSRAPELAEIAQMVSTYASSSDWALLDLIALAACCTQPPERIAVSLSPVITAYQALRMVDDVIDGHLTYKG